MDFAISEEQVAIADLAACLFSDHCTDEQLLAYDNTTDAYDQVLWKKVVDAGLQALLLPEVVGGSGLGMLEFGMVMEAQGRALAPVPLWRHQLAVATLLRFGADARARSLASAAASGEPLATLSLDGLAQARGIELRASCEGGRWRLDGVVPAVAQAAQAAWALLTATVDGQLHLVLVELSAAGIKLVPATYTQGEAVADIVCAQAIVPVTAILPAAALVWLEPRAIACVAALQLGVTEQQLKRTAEYINERKQFDRVIASFQAVQMQMADGLIAREVLRTSLWQLCYRLDQNLGAQSQALATKYLASEVGHRVGHMAQHLHGGMGVDLTYPMHRYLYWSRALGLALGGSAATLARLGDWLADNDTLGWKYDLDEPPAL